MSDNIPFEIQVEIIKRLPPKSLIQARSVSKAWKSLIDSSHFIARYSSQVQHLFVKYRHLLLWENYGRFEERYDSVVDDDSFPHQKVSLTLPLFVSMLQFSQMVGSSHGLLCLYGYYRSARDFPSLGTSMAVVWNVSIRKAVAVVVPNLSYGLIHDTVIGFGVCYQASDPKIVQITSILSPMECKMRINSIVVFTLSTGAWKSLYSNLLGKLIRFNPLQVVVDGFLFWLATEMRTMDGGSRYYNLIISFDITREEFVEVNFPDNLAHTPSHNLYISKLRNSLIVLERDVDANNPVTCVWMMEDGVPKLFTKMFAIYTPEATLSTVLEFRKSGDPVIDITELRCGMAYKSSLFVYEPYSKHISNLGFIGSNFSVYSYMETLLLLDQQDFVIYYNGKRYIFRREAFEAYMPEARV